MQNVVPLLTVFADHLLTTGTVEDVSAVVRVSLMGLSLSLSDLSTNRPLWIVW